MPEKARHFLDNWYNYMAAPDPALLRNIVAKDATILSPAYYSPKTSQSYVTAILTAVTNGLQDFTYTKEWIDGREIILEFEASIGKAKLKGIDRIKVDDDGRMSEIEVLIRPLNGLVALAEHVKASLTAGK